MRFRKWPRPTRYEETPRKRAAFLAKQHRERQALPLFAPMIAEQQHGVEEEMAHRARWWPKQQQDRRDERAAVWRQARARLFAFPAEQRPTIRRVWRDCPYPADPYSFAGFLHQIETGKLDLARPPWRYHAHVEPRTTPDPKTFDEAFRQIGQKKVGGGPKTTEADEFLFCGNLGKGLLYLTSRVRLMDPRESFMTSAPHRLRDSHVGRAGHWIDIAVRGVCPDEDLELIRRLAQAADARPVQVRLVDRPIPMKEDGTHRDPHRLLILACSATKRRDPGRIEAIERYDGPLWQTVRAVSPDRMLTKVAVLSARYGFRDSRTPIEDYDARLTRELADRMIAGGMTTRWPRPPSPRRPDSYGVHPGCEIASLSHHGTRPFTDIALVGGHLYLDVMRSFLGGFRRMRCVAPDARITEINAGIGVMRQQLRAWLEEAQP